MLQVSNLTRRYGNFLAVNNSSFTIQKGEVVGLLGHNGAGKTTIMKMISGYLEPDSGRVSINDIDLASDMKLAQRDLGYLPENLPIYPEMTVADYLDYAAELKGIDKRERMAELKRVIAATELSEKLLMPIFTLSRGYKQRVGVAQAILGKPKLLILDEPTNGLDPTQTELMRQLILDIAKDATVILSTHIMQEVDAVCDRVLILNRGELVINAQLASLRQSDRLYVKCSLTRDKFNVAIVGLGEFSIDSEEETGEGVFQYVLGLNESTRTDAFLAKIASAITGAGELYELHREQRDLESLFKEASGGNMEVSNAA